jgi:Uma2 family endonuclease
MVSTRLSTIDDLIALGQSAPFELIEGELIEVSPVFANSSIITARLAAFIGHHVITHALGWVSSAEGGYILRRNPDTLVAPDIGFVTRERLPVGYDGESFFPVPPDFAVEVVSSSDRTAEVMRKLSLYLAAGVSLVWIVYPRQQAVTVYEAGDPPATLRPGERLYGGSLLPGLQIEVAAIFATITDV